MNLTLCLRAGGQRFNNHNFYYYYVSINPTMISCSVRERNRKAKASTIGRLREAKMAPLKPGQWYQADVRAIDNHVVMFIDGKQVLDAPVPLGGGHINFLCQSPVDLADVVVREIPTPSQAELWNVRIPFSAEASKLDGKGNDPLWAKGYTTDAFVNRGAANRKERTEVTLLRTTKALYLRLICYGDSKTIRSNQTQRDDDQWKDDCIEISLDPANSRTDYYYLVVNPAGVQFDALASAGMNINKAGNGDWVSRSSVEPGRWIVEFELPFSTFGTPGEGAVWLLGLNRSGENIRQSWTDGSYHSPNSFRTMEVSGE